MVESGVSRVVRRPWKFLLKDPPSKEWPGG
jgi:hypothetical protein